MPHNDLRQDNQDDMDEYGKRKRKPKSLQLRRIERTLEDVDDEARGHHEEKDIDDAVDRVLLEEPGLAHRRAEAHQHEQDRDLLRDDKEVSDHPTSRLKSRST